MFLINKVSIKVYIVDTMHMQNWSIIFKKINKTNMYIQKFDISGKVLLPSIKDFICTYMIQ